MEIQQSISEHKTSTGFVSSRRGRARIGTSPTSERWDVLHRPRRWQRGDAEGKFGVIFSTISKHETHPKAD